MSKANGNQSSQAVAEKPDRVKLADTGKRIDSIRRTYETALAEAGNDYERGCVLACAMIDLRQAVKDYLPVLKQLQGSKLGFLTDRDPGKDWKNQGPYPEQVIVDCAIEAVICGARWTNNEFNVISGGCYLTKAYWWRKVTEIEGLTDLDLNPGVPEFVNQKCVVRFQSSWKLDGKAHKMERVIPIIVRNNQTDDATLGKAEAKMLKAIYKKLTGTEITGTEDDQEPAPTKSAPKPEAVADRVADETTDAEIEGEPFDWSAGKDAAEKEAIGAMR